MRIYQVLPTISYGDAVGNDALAILNILIDQGYETAIYAEGIDKRVDSKFVYSLKKFPKVYEKDIVLYHFSIGTELNYWIAKLKCRKILIYHNVTPFTFFKDYNRQLYNLTYQGKEGLEYLKDKIDYCWADSEFNKNDLIKNGYKCKIDVLPIIIPFQDYEKNPNNQVLKKYDDDWVNILFVGRIVPNKKFEDIIKAFYYYKTFINAKSRLILVGSHLGNEIYYNKLLAYVFQLGLSDVLFTGHIRFDEILAYYKIADVFLSMSEHEGFCVPLIESMYFDLPIIAYNAAAVPDTLNGSGILISEKNPALVAKLIESLVLDKGFRQSIISEERIRLEDYSYKKISSKLIELLKSFISK